MNFLRTTVNRQFRPCFRPNSPSIIARNRPFSFSPHRLQPKPPRTRGQLDEFRASDAFEEPFANEIRRPSIFRPAMFTLGLSLGAFGLGALYTNYDTQRWMNYFIGRGTLPFLSTVPTNDVMGRARKMEMGNLLVEKLERLKNATAALPKMVSVRIQHLYVILANDWLKTPEAKRTCYTITALNALVFLAWQIPRLHPFMMRSFMHHPLSGRSYTLITSVFSHKSFVHFLFNSIGLISFGPAVHQMLQNNSEDHQSTSRFHFLSFYITTGVLASFVSHLYSARFRFPRLLAQLADPVRAKSLTLADASILPSLGASGAIYGLLTYTALAMPETNVALIFLPMVPIPIGGAVSSMVLLDVMGILRGWKMFDHWAHLTGAVCGVVYFSHGIPFWHWLRARLAWVTNTTQSS